MTPEQHPYGEVVGLAQQGYDLAQNIFVKLTDAVAIAGTKGTFPSKEWEEAQSYMSELLKNLAAIERKAQENKTARASKPEPDIFDIAAHVYPEG